MSRGYSQYFATNIAQIVYNDYSQNKKVPLKQKIWAYKHGFLVYRTLVYDINESNYKEHMPDFEYYKLHPINGKYSSWIDDKLILRYLLDRFSEFMPRYYFQLEKDDIFCLMDCPPDISPGIEGILELLKREKRLAFKVLSGSLGEGFYRIELVNGQYLVNYKLQKENEVRDLIRSLHGYLVTEYVTAHDDIKKIYDATPNTLRVQVVRNKGKDPDILASFIRFGNTKSGVQETPLAGGIIAGVDLKDGKVFEPKFIRDNKLIGIKKHPDTNENMEITLPEWDKIKSIVLKIAEYIPQLSYLGFDIIITNDGFKIIEINSLTSSTVLSHFCPLFANQLSREFFMSKFQERPRVFKRILKLLS